MAETPTCQAQCLEGHVWRRLRGGYNLVTGAPLVWPQWAQTHGPFNDVPLPARNAPITKLSTAINMLAKKAVQNPEIVKPTNQRRNQHQHQGVDDQEEEAQRH